ncbi:hypothetical protein GOODEAATRI_031752, partial [Goodea atripinnis]
LRGRTLYYAQTSKVSCQSIIFDEVDLTDASVAESSTKNVNNSFTTDTCLQSEPSPGSRMSHNPIFRPLALVQVHTTALRPAGSDVTSCCETANG